MIWVVQCWPELLRTTVIHQGCVVSSNTNGWYHIYLQVKVGEDVLVEVHEWGLSCTFMFFFNVLFFMSICSVLCYDGFSDLRVTCDVDIVKYLLMTLKQGNFFLLLFLMESLCLWMFEIFCTAGPFGYGNKNYGLNSYHCILLFWIVLRIVVQKLLHALQNLHSGFGSVVS